MNSYIWRLFRADTDNPAVTAVLTWAIVARIDEAARLYNPSHTAPRLLNRPLRYEQFLEALNRRVEKSEIYVTHRKTANIEQLRKFLYHPGRGGPSARKIPIDDYGALIKSLSIEAITAVSCGEWLFEILESNEAFAREFFIEDMTNFVFAGSHPRARRVEKLTDYFHKNVVEYIGDRFGARRDQTSLAKALARARMLGITSKMAGSIARGSEEDLLSRISYVLFALQKRICPRISDVYPVHFSAWSLAHICVATDDRDGLASVLFMVGRQSRGAGTHHLGQVTRVVRDAIFSFVPKRNQEEIFSGEQNSPLSQAAYISSEGRTGYQLVGLPAASAGIGSDKGAPAWWEYSGRSSRDNMKLFFFSQHVEPRSQAESSGEPRIFNALMLGHILDAKQGDLPGVWIALVKRVKNYTIADRRETDIGSGL